MKKTLLFISLIFFVFSGFSQINWDWETDTTGFSMWQWGTADPVVVENPVKTFYNMSDSVIQCKTGTSAWGWGYGASLSSDLTYKPESDTVFTIKILADVAAPILFKIEEETNGGINSETWGNYTTPGQWQELTFPMKARTTDTLEKWIFWFDPMVEVGTEIDFWIDDVMNEEGTLVLYSDHDKRPAEGPIAWEGFGGANFTIVQNPSKDGINKSDSVGHAVTTAETWDGSFIYTDGVWPLIEDTVFTIDVYSESTGTVMFKIEKSGQNQFNIENRQEYTTPGEWVTMRYAFPNAPIDTMGAMVLFFDMDKANVGQEWFFDNIQGPKLKMKEWAVPVNVSVVDEVGVSEMAIDIWWNVYGGDGPYDEDDPNVYLFSFDLEDDDADGTWEGSILVPWTNLVTGVNVDHLWCLFADGEEYEDFCDIEFSQAGWDSELNVNITFLIEAVEDLESTIPGVFPNPVADVLTVSNAGNIHTVEVYSIIGQRVMSLNNLESENLSINVSGLNSGIYLVNLIENDGTLKTHKIVVK